MSLQYKISVLLLAVFVLFGALIYTVQQMVIMPSFLALESEDAREDMARVEQALEREIAALVPQADDWSSWDDTYQYLVDSNTEFRDSNLHKRSIFELMKLDLIYFVDTAGQVVWSVVYDRETGEEVKLPELSDVSLSPDHPLRALNNKELGYKGLLLTSRGPMLLVAKPSLDSFGRGPRHGTLLFGRFLDKPALSRIAKQAQVELEVFPLQGKELDAEHAAVAIELGRSSKSVIRADDSVNRVYKVMQDVFGEPALLLQVKSPKLISAEGRAANKNARIALVGAALVILLALLIGLRLIVLKPIAQLIAHADEVGRRDDLSMRLDADRHDELGDLSREFNRMVERLAEARKAMQEQSRQAGIAELASGVLHNIGNAITPLKVRVATLESTLRAAPLPEINMALVELGEGGTASERSADLRAFLDLAARELSTLTKDTIDQVVSMGHQVEHVQKILSDQESISRSTRVMLPVKVSDLVSESIELLGADMSQKFRIDVDPGLDSSGQVLGSPVALQQIVINLLKNAAESIRALIPEAHNGRIAIASEEESREGRAMIGLRIRDNGAGISQENLSQLFQRGFSTKSRPTSGQGLHWCAITAAAFGGRITIDSDGPGHGATVSLWLPKAKSN